MGHSDAILATRVRKIRSTASCMGLVGRSFRSARFSDLCQAALPHALKHCMINIWIMDDCEAQAWVYVLATLPMTYWGV